MTASVEWYSITERYCSVSLTWRDARTNSRGIEGEGRNGQHRAKGNVMKQRTVRRKWSASGGVVRSGRPPRDLAGEVEERILDAAAKVFLERGFEGASVDEIADVARAGKPTRSEER